MIDQYCREAGVRSLSRYTKKLVDKIAFKIVTKIDKKEIIDPIEINLLNLKEYLGNPTFDEENMYQNMDTPPGVVTGLAYTQYGGSVLYLESRRRSFGPRDTQSPSLKVTGSLGDVMKESMQIAYTYARSYLNSLGNDYLETNEIHIHAPEGATPKDGPSAGITIASS